MASSQEFLRVYQPPTTGSGQGLLTTVAQLPTKYKIRYLTHTVESPLDLSVKPTTETICGPITPPPSPPKKRYRDENFNTGINGNSSDSTDETTKILKAELQLTIQKEVTPQKPIKVSSVQRTSKSQPPINKDKKSKAMRKLKFDEDTSSPVSGTIIRPLEEIGENSLDQPGDIDPQYNIVEVTEEAKAELAIIKNVIGAYVCKLCRIEFDDAFGLARHRCSCIVLLEYRCPECGKRFNCPANLASHRRWHKPKDEVLRKQNENNENEPQHRCMECGKSFKRQAYLRKHMLTHKKDNVSPAISSEHNSVQSSRSSLLTYRTDDSNSGESHLSIAAGDSNNSVHYKEYKEYQENRYYKFDSEDMESRSDCSSPGRLRIVENSLTEEENIAAAALAHLRNGPSVIQHTTAAVTGMVF
ncbi:unnamed protein product [Hermetia illucens]|uniref:C2H2-type domain-containing protein n=1 Tax=Hermetia illucens TaxID=343691 RepID=A0A7R8V7E5_HERIL|nr:zinc finger protein 436 [Hermetia illucens]CAD7093809.1 unnamed protein product [Hermetia illucens]